MRPRCLGSDHSLCELTHVLTGLSCWRLSPCRQHANLAGTLSGHASWVLNVAFCPDDTHFVSRYGRFSAASERRGVAAWLLCRSPSDLKAVGLLNPGSLCPLRFSREVCRP